MQRKLYRLAATPLSGMMFLLLPAALSAQSFWLEHSPGKTFIDLQIGYQTARIQLGINTVNWTGLRWQSRNRLRTAFTRGSDFTARAEDGED